MELWSCDIFRWVRHHDESVFLSFNKCKKNLTSNRKHRSDWKKNKTLSTVTRKIPRKRFQTSLDIKHKSKYVSCTWCLNVYLLTYWSAPRSQGSEAWSFMSGDYAENWASISLLEPRGAQWLSGPFSLTGRWKWALVFGHASLREKPGLGH